MVIIEVEWLMMRKISSFFFFQAEDGIRDLVRSRGLGDVYKRQSLAQAEEAYNAPYKFVAKTESKSKEIISKDWRESVSYTHLTLPTIYSV